MMRKILFLLIMTNFSAYSQILSERDRATFKDEILEERFNIPPLNQWIKSRY
jgi:hypothetical protein